MEIQFVKKEENPRNQDSTSKNNHHEVLVLSNSFSSISPSNPFVLSFNNLTYSVKAGPKTVFLFHGKTLTVLPEHNNKSKSILKDVSDEAREGEIMAILGASGSGKSTLTDALANRIAKHILKGSVTLNVEVLESAEFRLPRSRSKLKKKARVQALIDQLGLRSAAKTVIGDEGHRGVSGGERRRVSIGINMIHDPILLFLDEPTSGLDSTSAFMVVKVLQRIAQSGSIVIMSIHQPSYRILDLLDRLLFLSQGQTLYSGSPANLSEFFSDFGHPIPENENPAEYAFDFIRELEETPSESHNLAEFNKLWQAVKNPRSSFVAFLSALVSDVLVSFVVVIASLAYFTLFSGFFISRTRLPGYWLWFHYLSVVKYPYEAVLLNEFRDPTKCFTRGAQIFDDTPLGELPVSLKNDLFKSVGNALGTSITGSTCLTTGKDILLQQGITELSKWNCFWITIGWGFFFRILFYLTLLFGSKNKRK
ncbi:hypothetical protein CRYUN_Cryun09bG0026500 [Craigia yunnanensis]